VCEKKGVRCWVLGVRGSGAGSRESEVGGGK
jgi:hypothetical protein